MKMQSYDLQRKYKHLRIVTFVQFGVILVLVAALVTVLARTHRG